jgi:hypothetical protein
MEFVVGVLVVVALLAIVARFVARDSSGQVRLPRVVDESIGMWVVRRLLGRPTDREVDPFARFRRPSTVLARRPESAASTMHGRLAQPARPDWPPRAAPRYDAPPADVPAVLGDGLGRGEPDPIPPAWSTVERTAVAGRPFGASIQATPAPPPRSRIGTALGYGVLVVAVAAAGLAVGALAGVASSPSAASPLASPLASAPRSGSGRPSAAESPAR